MTFWQKFLTDNLDKFIGVFIFFVLLVASIAFNIEKLFDLLRDSFLVISVLVGVRKAAAIQEPQPQSQQPINQEIKADTVSIDQSTQQNNPKSTEKDLPKESDVV